MPRRCLIALSLTLPLLGSALLAATLPREAPKFAVAMTNKGTIPLSTYRGKTVVLAFILTNCSHCQNFTRLLTKIQNEFSAQGLQAIESAVEQEARAAVPGFVRTYQPPFPVGFNSFDQAVDFLQHPKMTILHMPAIAVINKQGMIVAQYQASDPFMADDKVEQNLRGLVRKLVARPAAKTPAKK